jgi:hypothetical protein
MRAPALSLGVLLVASLTSGCAAESSDLSEEDSSGNAISASGVTLKSSDSAATKAFLDAFLPKFQEIATRDFDQNAWGAGTAEDLARGVYKARRNDGKIECTETSRTTSCVFSLRPAEVTGGKMVLRGNSNTWAGELHATFSPRRAVPASTGGAAGEAQSTVIGKRGTKPNIECVAGPPERQLATSVCTVDFPSAGSSR